MATAQKTRPLPAYVEAAIAALPESGTITVASKLPNGIIMRLFEMREQSEVTMSGEHTIRMAHLQEVEPVTIKGCAQAWNAPIMTIGGYALTPNVDAQFFAEWLRENADSDMVKNRLIFAHENDQYVRDKAEDQIKVLSGLEPMVRSEDGGDPRDPNRRKLKTFTTKDDDADVRAA